MKRYTLLLLITLTAFCSACKKESKNVLLGKWIYKIPEASNPEQYNELNFDGTNNVTNTLYHIEPATGRLLGYSYKYVANYRLKSSTAVELYNIKAYVKGEQVPYTDEDKLMLKTGNSPFENYYYSIDQQRNELRWDYNCGPYAYCAGTLRVYTKK
jgi:hypothetical protein